MVIIVDTNILISASLNANSELYNIIISNFTKIDFVTPEFALKEIFINQKSICTKTKTSLSSIFVAFALALDCLLWTGDKKLIKGVRKKGFINITNTVDFKRILKGL